MVFNCYVHDANFIGSGASCVYLGGKANIISHNTLTRAGRTVLAYSEMYKALIQNNDMSHSGKLTSDLGLTYGNVIEGGNSEVRYNLMHDNDDDHLDMGLILRPRNPEYYSHHNIIWGIGFSSFHTNHYAAYHLAYNNTFISEHEMDLCLPGEIVTAPTCWNADMPIIYLSRSEYHSQEITIGMLILQDMRILMLIT